jgi:DNA-binding transcriptional LysR family regulator
MLHAIVPYIPEFRELYPDIQLELNSNDLIIDLLEQSTDIAIRIGTLADSTLHARSLGCSPLNILASPAYIAAHGMPNSVAELASHSLIGFTPKRWPEPMASALCTGRSLADRAEHQRVQWRDGAASGVAGAGHRVPVAFHDPSRHRRRPFTGGAG